MVIYLSEKAAGLQSIMPTARRKNSKNLILDHKPKLHEYAG